MVMLYQQTYWATIFFFARWMIGICSYPIILSLHLEVHSKLHSITPMATKVHVILLSCVGCDTMELESILLLPPSVWSTPLNIPKRCGICMHQLSTSGRRRRRLHTLIHSAMRGCGLTSLVACINDKNHDIRERNAITRSEIWTTNICSLGFRDIREWVILWRLILRSLGCIMNGYP